MYGTESEIIEKEEQMISMNLWYINIWISLVRLWSTDQNWGQLDIPSTIQILLKLSCLFLEPLTHFRNVNEIIEDINFICFSNHPWLWWYHMEWSRVAKKICRDLWGAYNPCLSSFPHSIRGVLIKVWIPFHLYISFFYSISI